MGRESGSADLITRDAAPSRAHIEELAHEDLPIWRECAPTSTAIGKG
jgi:hypothetical protein